MIFTSEKFLTFKSLFIVIASMMWSGCAAEELPMAALIAKCAPTVAPSTMASIVKVESSGHIYALADAGPVKLPWSVRKSMVKSHFLSTKEEAVTLANSLIAKGHTVSLGLSQVNDRNLKSLGLSIEQVFDPCTNLSAGGRILTDFYRRASREFGPGEQALRAAISAYNSGSWERGEANGYVGQVYQAAGIVPDLKVGKSGRGVAVASVAPPARSAEQWWESRAELLRQARESELESSKE